MSFQVTDLLGNTVTAIDLAQANYTRDVAFDLDAAYAAAGFRRRFTTPENRFMRQRTLKEFDAQALTLAQFKSFALDPTRKFKGKGDAWQQFGWSKHYVENLKAL